MAKASKASTLTDPLHFLMANYDEAVLAVTASQIIKPEHVLPHLPHEAEVVIIAAGKAAMPMARQVEKIIFKEIGEFSADNYLKGLAVAPYGHLPLHEDKRPQHYTIDCSQTGHPRPDNAGVINADKAMALVQPLSEDAVVFLLGSGGASAGMTRPADDLVPGDPARALKVMDEATKELLSHAVPIGEMNTIRRHLSGFSGGRLAAATKAQVVNLLISDVRGDHAHDIGSGPGVGDPTTFADALKVVSQYQLNLPSEAMAYLEAGARGERTESIKPAQLEGRVQTHILANVDKAAASAATHAREAGFTANLSAGELYGNAVEEGEKFAKRMLDSIENGNGRRPVMHYSFGECGVELKGDGTGVGGRNTLFLLAFLNATLKDPRYAGIEAQGYEICALAADTDGVDGGGTKVAGAVVNLYDLRRVLEANKLDPQKYLDNCNSHGFFRDLEAAGGLDKPDSHGGRMIMPPTLTNVNDFRAVMVRKRPVPGLKAA